MKRTINLPAALRNAMAIASAFLAASCSATYSDARYSPEQLKRQVVDATTRQGIAGALVVFGWTRRQVDIGHGASTECVRVELVRGDSDGRYKVPDWQGRNGGIRSIFLRGYVEVNDPVASSKGIDKLTRGNAEFSKRIEELGRALVQCNGTEDKKLLSLYQEIYDDGRSIAKSAQERKLVDRYFLSPLDTAKYGDDEARRRAHQREIER